ncbi:GTP cyclohydrolase FolE2 [Pseudoxanthomonas wuyuanensis]|uniref:GTP cyclohydrolase FolE2 n=1 Tax=Pseudoxanthomonas wuyuanensis TaxID=1073196 RepID=A0A286CW50_9GAMM|nr:GTP cyclohydrolase FolE2 [Pseudoxanthomonas wuyuanensis]KAF1721219.1 GTP cyclohydrolase I FolE2 [Pseudoxanthomonas wuyuanensis]SOD50623.1 GTP cyclohydrolase I [Pseudoxanthomonas wuyuanensis]
MSSPPSAPRADLPDVADHSVPFARPLDWVGMDNIALPIRISDGVGGQLQVAASIDLSVNLVNPDARGIHMSRLYLQLQDGLAREAITPAGLRHLLQDGIASQNGLASQARLTLRYEALLQRRALESDYAGWKRYPVGIEATLSDGHLHLALSFAVEYSSTCPASAALSRQANAERFADDFAAATDLSVEGVHDWLASERGLAATPHAQRSRAQIRVELRPQFDELPLVPLIDAVEAVLATPVQTAVKRVDEQAFARLNAENLMFCEDAARRVASVLSSDARIARYQATVAHYESLHPHDAVARVSGSNP